MHIACFAVKIPLGLNQHRY